MPTRPGGANSTPTPRLTCKEQAYTEKATRAHILLAAMHATLAASPGSQRAQDPFNKEYTLNHKIKAPII